jgi:L-fuconolactonase
LPFDVVVRREMLPQVRALAENCRETTLVLNHLGKPRVEGAPETSWRKDLEALATNCNVFCKISGLMTEAHSAVLEPRTYSPYILHAIDVFGWERVMFGSDWPVCTVVAGYRQWLDIVRHVVSTESNVNQDKLFIDNAQRVYFGDRG